MGTLSYPNPVYSHNNFTGASGAGLTIDTGNAQISGVPVPMLCVITNAATVKIEGSNDNVNWLDFSSGGFTSSFAKDLIIGIRFWRTNVSGNNGSVTSSVGILPAPGGGWCSPRNPVVENNATAGQ